MASQQPLMARTLTKTPTILSSPIITVTADNGDTTFYVHLDALKISSPLYRAFTGQFIESTTHHIALPDWDGSTVSRFLQYLYVGTYSLDSDDSSPLLSHAKIYALADYKDVPQLQRLALTRLSHALNNLSFDAGNAAASADAGVGLIDYVYTNSHAGQEIRTIVCSFAVKRLEILMRCEDMEALLNRGGDFTVELMKMTAEEKAQADLVAAVKLAEAETLIQASMEQHSLCEDNTERIGNLETRVEALEVARNAAMSPAAAQRAYAARMTAAPRRAFLPSLR